MAGSDSIVSAWEHYLPYSIGEYTTPNTPYYGEGSKPYN